MDTRPDQPRHARLSACARKVVQLAVGGFPGAAGARHVDRHGGVQAHHLRHRGERRDVVDVVEHVRDARRACREPHSPLGQARFSQSSFVNTSKPENTILHGVAQ